MWYDDSSASDTTATIDAVVQSQSPMRPPRRRCNRLALIEGAQGPAKRSHSLTTGTTPGASEIKSILKKPVSLTTDDLSPVRSRKTVAVAVAIPDFTRLNTVAPCLTSGSRKKTKKQVQFDIVSVMPKKLNGGETESQTVTATENNESLPQHFRLRSPTGKFLVIFLYNFMFNE